MSAYYDKYNYQAFWRGRRYEDNSDRMAILRLLNLAQGPRNSLLDVGGGYGRNATIYTPLWHKAVLLDPSSKNLSQAKTYLKNPKNVTFVQGKAEETSFPDSSFDTILCVRVFHHLPNPEPAVKEFSRLLRPGGHLILEVANKIHVKARLKALVGGNLNPLSSDKPLDRRSEEMVKQHYISFVNHHPETIKKLLNKYGLEIKEALSVSNFRSPLANLPIISSSLIALESAFQKPLAPFWFGPSIYFLAKKA